MNNKQHFAQAPKEVIVVEGRDDSKRLYEIFGPNLKTIESNGSAINSKCLEQITAAHEKFGVIVMTDPDYQGDRVRNIISQAIPNVKHAHLRRDEARSHKEGESLGVEHASDSAIIQSLAAIMTANKENYTYFSVSELIEMKLISHPQARKRRAYLSDRLRLGSMNGKQLQRKLALYNISREEISKIMKEGELSGQL